jgi:hypothetical protein
MHFADPRYVTLFLPCFYPVSTLFLPCFYPVLTLLLPCSYPVLTLFLPLFDTKYEQHPEQVEHRCVSRCNNRVLARMRVRKRPGD